VNLIKKSWLLLFFSALFLKAFAEGEKENDFIPLPGYIYFPPLFTAKRDTPEKDIGDVLNSILKEHLFGRRDTALKRQGKLYTSVLPAAGYTLQTSFAASVTANTAFYTDDPAKENISVISIEPIYSVHKQFYALTQSDIWSKGNKFDYQGVYGIYKYPQDTYGLGGHSSTTNAELLDYYYLRLRQDALKTITPGFFGGLGYALDYHWDIIDHGLPNGEISDYQKYGGETSSVSSGVTLNLLYDTRRNSINPPGGYYINVVYRENPTFLGSNSDWSSLLIDARKYIRWPQNTQNVLAFWSYNSLTLSGKPPYLDLPSTAWDAYANQGRGYIQSRFRGNDLLSLESEYRFKVTHNGLFGGVVFVNAQTVSNWPSNTIDTIWPAVGAGVRIKINKHSDTNLALDYAIGLQGSNGVFINLGEVF
jgi:hypothetical protein